MKVAETSWNYDTGARELWFLCPGCQAWHNVPISVRRGRNRWTWNGSRSFPSLEPSRVDWSEACRFSLQYGALDYAADCHHAAAGLMVALPSLDSMEYEMEEGLE